MITIEFCDNQLQLGLSELLLDFSDIISEVISLLLDDRDSETSKAIGDILS